MIFIESCLESPRCLLVIYSPSQLGNKDIQLNYQRYHIDIISNSDDSIVQNIRDFYLASDGFRLSWSYNYVGQLLPLGNMTLNRVADLRRVRLKIYTSKARCPSPLSFLM